MRTSFFATMIAIALPVLTGCNAYSGLASPGNDEEYTAEAQHCLEQGDYNCALTNYANVSNLETRYQKLCAVNMSKAGLSINVLLNVVTQSSTGANILAKVAQLVMPWTSDKAQATTDAVTACTNYVANTTNTKFATFLQSLSQLIDCSTRMAKTDLFVANSSADTACTTPGNADGQLTKSDIDSALDGTCSGGQCMCKLDVVTCVSDIVAISAGQLNAAGLASIAANVSALPADLSNLAAGVVLQRAAVIQAVP